ncbi:dipeptidase PepV [Salinicoccus halodurans]|uniref:Dipeptidase PepV n=1 Tax=Salinicoccus halodurans TaxID=407035 RepID=A0A0F7D4I9_9STAP|nr:dipeptidase PepV [Salinicoccus halodurans]AKG74315.1 dipeptidase PepV [Salinicoccus halodurans]SFK94384.1 succinyl-diaminopimelate desuccinylase [Salinicoccus halodurans]
MDYTNLVSQYKDDLIKDLFGLLEIESVKGEPAKNAPVGEGPKAALDYMMSLGERDGMISREVDSLAGHLEVGRGERLFGILGHVDVVPPGNGWDTNPFEPVLKDGEIIARGVQDDKGPTMAAYYALKILKEQGMDFQYRTRLIIGTDEESDWQCTDAYFKSEEMPDAGFAPDAAFPIIHGEKGITTFNIIQKQTPLDEAEPNIELKVLISGERYNMVPEEAEAKLKVLQNMSEVIQSFEDFLRQDNVEGEYEIDNGFLKLSITGQSAHGSTPEAGVNAGFILLRFLDGLELDNNATAFVKFANSRIIDNFDGGDFGMSHSHEELGETSVNTGMINYTEVDGGIFGVNLRYPEGLDFEAGLEKLEKEIQEDGFIIEDVTHQAPHYVDKEDPLVQVLLDAYRNHTDDDTEPFTIGGGTYARTLEKGVAFGAMFKDTADTMHQKNERMRLDELLLATEIYLEALHRICIKGEMDEN